MDAYRPSNSTEGFVFEAQFCDRCQHEKAWRDSQGMEDACVIHTWALAVGINDPQFPREWVEDDNGPRCTAFMENTNEPG